MDQSGQYESVPLQKKTESWSSASIPFRRLLPIRKGQYERRFVRKYMRVPDQRRSFRLNFYESDRPYTCWRQLLLRRWLATQLPHGAYITGNEFDINLYNTKSIPHDDAVMFQFVMPESVAQPGPNLLRLSQRMKRPWEHASVRAQYLNAKYNTGDVSMVTRSQQFAATPFFPLTPPQQNALKHLLCPSDLDPTWKVGLFVEDPGHTFSVIVSLVRMDSGSENGSSCVIDDILILDTVILKRGEWFASIAGQNIAIAMALNYSMPGARPENLFDLVNRVRRPVTDVATTFLQAEEGDDGFCQHWNTYFLYQILVKREDPEAMYERLIAMGPQKRWQLIVNFANAAVSDSAVTSIPVQESNNY